MKNEKLNKLKEDLNNEEKLSKYIWKYLEVAKPPRKYREVRLVDMPIEELTERYVFCEQMLNSSSVSNPGRNIVKNKIQKVINMCNAEIMVRNDIINTGLDRSSILNIIYEYKMNNKKNPKLEEVKGRLWGDIVKTTPRFSNIKVRHVVDACKNTLGVFPSSLISYTLIAYLGICPNEDFNSKYNMFCKKEGRQMTHAEFIKQYLNIDGDFNFHVRNTGLTIKEAELAVNLKLKPYSEMTIDELELASQKLLPIALDRVINQIDDWTERLDQIKEVAKYKNYELPNSL